MFQPRCPDDKNLLLITLKIFFARQGRLRAQHCCFIITCTATRATKDKADTNNSTVDVDSNRRSSPHLARILCSFGKEPLLIWQERQLLGALHRPGIFCCLFKTSTCLLILAYQFRFDCFIRDILLHAVVITPIAQYVGLRPYACC